MTKVELREYKWASWRLTKYGPRTKIHKVKFTTCTGIKTLCGMRKYYPLEFHQESNRIRSKSKAGGPYHRCKTCERIHKQHSKKKTTKKTKG